MRMLIAAIAALLLLSGCSSDDEGGESKPDESYPPCAEVWVDGGTLPDGYEGCTDEDGGYYTSGTSDCPDGEAPLMTYEPDGGGFFTLADGTIVEAGEDYANDPRYGERFATC